MASLPPIPPRPAGRPETWPEYQRRRQVIALWRRVGELIATADPAAYRAPSPLGSEFRMVRIDRIGGISSTEIFPLLGQGF
jgi:hypothetical protein